MDIKSLAVEMLMKKLGGTGDTNAAESALGELVGQGKDFDLGGLVGQLTGSGGDIADKAKSWLGDGDNAPISASQIQDVLGGDKVEVFAKSIGVSRERASSGLSEMLPQLIDKSSQGGNLLDAIGGAGGLAGLASKFLK
jgi:uncharacterized protein YidB (DUF937 family)